MNKQELRKWAGNIRKGLDMAKISAILINKLLQTKEYQNSQKIMLFYPLKNEVNLLSLMEDKSKDFYLPRVSGTELECCPYNINDKLATSSLHIQEPICKACSKNNIDLVIVPAFACDKNNYRLGYGGGYYDRFLKDYNGCKISCIPKELYVETINPEKFDIQMDKIIVT